MSKPVTQKPKPEEEEDWEDVEEEEEEYEEEAEEEEDTSLNNAEVVAKYKRAAQWTNEALNKVISLVKPGASVLALCQAGDEMINTKCATMYRGIEKGISFPTCISVNSAVCHNSPVPGEEGDKAVLAENDVIRIELGIQIDGYNTMTAHTMHVTADGTLNPESREAQAIASGYATLDAAARQLRPDSNVLDVSAVIEKCAAHFGLTPVEGVLSHEMKRYIVDSYKVIPGKDVPEHKVHNYNISPMSVWALDIVLTTGKGQKLKERDTKTSVYKVSLENEYQPKLNAAVELQKEIDEKFQTFCFGVRNCANKKARLGLSEMIKHNSVVGFPVLYEKDGEVVVRFKSTFLVTAKKIERVTGVAPQKGCPKPKPYDGNEELATLAKVPYSLKAKKTEAAAEAQ